MGSMLPGPFVAGSLYSLSAGWGAVPWAWICSRGRQSANSMFGRLGWPACSSRPAGLVTRLPRFRRPGRRPVARGGLVDFRWGHASALTLRRVRAMVVSGFVGRLVFRAWPPCLQLPPARRGRGAWRLILPLCGAALAGCWLALLRRKGGLRRVGHLVLRTSAHPPTPVSYKMVHDYARRVSALVFCGPRGGPVNVGGWN
jgi:hypothetical protein